MVSFFNHQTLNLVPLFRVVVVVVVGQRKNNNQKKNEHIFARNSTFSSLFFKLLFFFLDGGNIKARVRHGMNNTETQSGALPWLAPWG